MLPGGGGAWWFVWSLWMMRGGGGWGLFIIILYHYHCSLDQTVSLFRVLYSPAAAGTTCWLVAVL